MSWITESVLVLRHMINDVLTPYKYDDDRLTELLIVSARMVQSEVNLVNTYTVEVDTTTLTPDPTDPTTKDDPFIELMTLKAACVLDRSEARTAATQAISIKDGSSAVDLRGSAESRIKLLKVNWCQEYQNYKEYYATITAIPGACIMTPFKVWTYGVSQNVDPYRMMR